MLGLKLNHVSKRGHSDYHHRSTTAQDFVGVMSGVPLALDGNAKGTPLITPTESWAVVLPWLPLPVIWLWRIWVKAFGMNILFIKLFCILQRKMLKRMLLLSTQSTCTKFVYRSGICFVFKWQRKMFPFDDVIMIWLCGRMGHSIMYITLMHKSNGISSLFALKGHPKKWLWRLLVTRRT